MKTHLEPYIDRGSYDLEDDGWHCIGLRQSPTAAIDRAKMYGEEVSKDSHALLRVEFSPLGGHTFLPYSKIRNTSSSRYCTKSSDKWQSYDNGVLHFNRNPPLSLCDTQDNRLVTTQFMEIT